MPAATLPSPPTTPVYLEFVELIARVAPEEIIAFQYSPTAQERLGDLIRRQKTEGITADETSELKYCLHIEHFVRMAKALAHQQLAARGR